LKLEYRHMWLFIKTTPLYMVVSEICRAALLSIAAPFVPVIAALICTTKRSVEGVKILDLMGH
jgi:hypothetical protein